MKISKLRLYKTLHNYKGAEERRRLEFRAVLGHSLPAPRLSEQVALWSQQVALSYSFTLRTDCLPATCKVQS